MLPKAFQFAFLVVFACRFIQSEAELYKSIDETTGLMKDENLLLRNLEAFLKQKQEKVLSLKRKLEEYKKDYTDAKKDPAAFLASPINAFLLTKRLTVDWKILQEQMKKEVGFNFARNMTEITRRAKFPTKQDMQGAIAALLRLQKTYHLEASKLASGILYDEQYGSKLSSYDCYEFGRQTLQNGDYTNAVRWLQEAEVRMKEENGNRTLPLKLHIGILENLAFAQYKKGDVTEASRITEDILKLDPTNKKAIENRDFYEKQRPVEMPESIDSVEGFDAADATDATEPQSSDDQEPVVKILHHNVPTMTVSPYVVQYKRYEELCRGKVQRSPSILRDLRCKYQNSNTPFLKIAPLKYEEMNLEPYVALFYNVISEKEVKVLQSLAKPIFRRAAVMSSDGGHEISDVRVSQVAWVQDNDHRTIYELSTRTADMTGLNMLSTAGLQISKYQPGGLYEPHHDFARKEEQYKFQGLEHLGNRIATVMYYLNDVESGGSTVFPELDIAVKPIKGAAIFWYNLHRSGVGNFLTNHGACPVLTGSKWVSNSWIHMTYQEFRRPCGLKPDHPSDLEWSFE